MEETDQQQTHENWDQYYYWFIKRDMNWCFFDFIWIYLLTALNVFIWKEESSPENEPFLISEAEELWGTSLLFSHNDEESFQKPRSRWMQKTMDHLSSFCPHRFRFFTQTPAEGPETRWTSCPAGAEIPLCFIQTRFVFNCFRLLL